MLKKLRDKYNALPLPVRAGAWFFVCNLLQKGISVLTTPIFTRLLSSAEYGTFYNFYAWRDILSIFITFGLASSVYQKKLVQLDGNELGKKVLTSSLQGLATTTALISFFVYMAFRGWLNRLFSLSTEYVVAIYVSVLVTTAFDFWATKKRVLFQYRPLIFMTIAIVVFKPMLSILMIYAFPSHKVDARIITLVAVEVVFYVGLYARQFFEGRRYYHAQNWKYALTYVFPLIPHYLSQRVLSQFDRIMINAMDGPSQAGIYSLGYSMGLLLNFVLSALDGVMAPWVYTKIKENRLHRIRKITLYPLAGMALLCVGFVAITPEVVSLFAPAEYHAAVWVIPPVLISTFLMMVYSFFIYFEYYFERTKRIMLSTMMSAVLNIALNYVFIGLFGYIAAGYTTMVSYMVYTFFHYWNYRKICQQCLGVSDVYNVKAIFVIFCALAVCTSALVALYGAPLVRYAIVFVLLCVAFVKRKEIWACLGRLLRENEMKL